MPNPFVTSIIATQARGASAPGFGTAMALVYGSASLFGAARTLRYSSLDDVASVWSTTSLVYRMADQYFGQSPARPETFVVGRGLNAPTMVYSQSIASLVASQTYTFYVACDGIADVSFSILLPTTDIVASAITTGTDAITSVGHGSLTGAGPYLPATTGTLPTGTGIAAGTNLWVIRVDDDNIKLATSYANAIAGTAIDITAAGSGTFTLTRTGNDVLVAHVVDRLNNVVGKNYTATSSGVTGAKAWTVTASTAGAWFAVGVDHSLVTSAVTHADPGVTADLTAIREYDDDWYQLLTAYNSTAMVLACAAFVESADGALQYHPTVSNTASITAVVGSAGATDVIDQLKTLNRMRTSAWYSDRPEQFLATAVAGKMLPKSPGSADYFAKQLSGAVPSRLTTTQAANLLAKNGNSYRSIDGVAVTVEGKTASGEWIDVVRNNDYVNATMRVAIWNLRLGVDVLPYTVEGLALVEGSVRAVLTDAASAGIYSADSIVIEIADLATVSASDKANRVAPLVKWSAQLQGSINKIRVSGSVYP